MFTVLNNEFIDAFEFDDKLFRKYSFPETGTKILQVIESSDTVCLDFFSFDLKGDYMVIIRGITDDGQPMHGECSFTVK